MDRFAATQSFLFFYISAHAANNKRPICAGEHMAPLKLWAPVRPRLLVIPLFCQHNVGRDDFEETSDNLAL